MQALSNSIVFKATAKKKWNPFEPALAVRFEFHFFKLIVGNTVELLYPTFSQFLLFLRASPKKMEYSDNPNGFEIEIPLIL